MAAAPQYATFTFKGLQSGKNLTVDAYLSDVASAYVQWDNGNGASSSSGSQWKAPEDVILVDFSIPTGMTDTKTIVPVRDGAMIPQQRLRYANFLNTLTYRPNLQLGFKAGTLVSAIQFA